MYTAIASFILVLALMLGGSSAAVLAAQDSLPDQSLYQLKTIAEDLALHSAFRNLHRLQMELDYADRRVSEMLRLHERQQEIPESAILRLQKHLDQALLISANFEEDQIVRALNQVRERLQIQSGLLAQDFDHDPLMLRIQEMIQIRIGWAELGLEEPNEFRQQARVRTQFNQQAQFDNQVRPAASPDFDSEPGEGSYGPGPYEEGPQNTGCELQSCDPAPAGGYSPGPGAEEKHRYGQGPENQPGAENGNPAPGQPASASENSGAGAGSNTDQESGKDRQDSSSNPEPAQGNDLDKGNGGKP